MILWLYEKIDRVTMVMELGAGVDIEITPKVVRSVFGFPDRPNAAPLPSVDGNTEALKWLRKELGITATKQVQLNDLYKQIKKGGTSPFTMQCIFLVIFKCIVCPTLHARIGREAGMIHNVDYKKLHKMDICRVVVDELKRGVKNFLAEKKNRNKKKGKGTVKNKYQGS